MQITAAAAASKNKYIFFQNHYEFCFGACPKSGRSCAPFAGMTLDPLKTPPCPFLGLRVGPLDFERVLNRLLSHKIIQKSQKGVPMEALRRNIILGGVFDAKMGGLKKLKKICRIILVAISKASLDHEF